MLCEQRRLRSVIGKVDGVGKMDLTKWKHRGLPDTMTLGLVLFAVDAASTFTITL